MNTPAVIEHEPVQPWDRQRDEGARAYAAFRIYRDLGPTDRSLSLVAQASEKSLTWMKEWSRRHSWVGRARAWDAENDRIKRAQHIKGLEEMARRHMATGQLLQQRSLRRFAEMTDEDVKAMTVSETIRLVEIGIRLERQGRADLDLVQPTRAGVRTEIPERPGARIIQFLGQHPDRIGPVVDALRQLRAAVLELDPTRGDNDALVDDRVGVEDDEEDEEGQEEGFLPSEPPSYGTGSSALSQHAGAESVPQAYPAIDGVPRGLPGFVTRRGRSRA
jgi:hypothetical protein